jgi:anti-anti-sigma regulatory factor
MRRDEPSTRSAEQAGDPGRRPVRTDVREVHRAGGLAAVVRLDGVLTIETAPQARAALLKAVASQPAVVVADLAAMSTPDDVVLSLFLSIARHAAAWPGIPLVLAQPSRAVAACLERTAVVRYVLVVPSVEAACDSVDRTPPHRITARLDAGPLAVTEARALARSGCARWRLPKFADVAELVMSELVSNAVRHSGGSLEVSVAMRQRHLHLSVRDGSSAPPRPGRNDGRGLMVVESLTTAWGSTAVDGGKVVWATLRLF